MMKTVKATREGLVGNKTASGYIIDTVVPFVALPSTKALGMCVYLWNPKTQLQCYAIVLDVGPWNIHDDEYVFGGARPLAEQNISLSGHGTNGAGIDLSQKVHTLLGCISDNEEIAWEILPTNLDSRRPNT